MKARHLLIALVLLVALAGCRSEEPAAVVVPDGAQAGDLTGMQPCEYQGAGDKTIYAAECGVLAVPENWELAGSRLIALPVVRIPATGPQPAEPVFYLQGGPGGPNLVWSPPAWLLEKHDVVMVGYRGVEGTVTLSCPEVNRMIKAHSGKDVFSEQARASYVELVGQCAQAHQQAGVDLSGYTVAAVVKDMEAARKALAYERINLFSESYGTRPAQLYAYMYPQSLHRLVLIGVNTPGHFIWLPADFEGMFAEMNELCAQDPACSSRTDDLAATIAGVNRRMPERWLFFNIDPDTVRLSAHFMFMVNANMTSLIDAYLAAAEGDPSGLAVLNLMVGLMMSEDVPVLGDQFSKGGSADLDRYAGIDSVSLGDTVMGAPLSEFVWPMAAEWPITLIPDELRELQESDVEMLLVNGTLDFSTPPVALDEARPYYHNAKMVLLPGFSHTEDVYTLQPAAYERLITRYYDIGVADDSLYVAQPLSFDPALSLTTTAKLLVGGLFLLPALLILAVVLLTRRLRKQRRAIPVPGVPDSSANPGFSTEAV